MNTVSIMREIIRIDDPVKAAFLDAIAAEPTNWVHYAAFSDWLEERDEDAAGEIREKWARRQKIHDAALALHARLAEIDPDRLTPTFMSRGELRKVFAARMRKEFKQLRLHGISVTAPNYSMAHSIDIEIPTRLDIPEGAADRPREECPAIVENSRMAERLERIILALFPHHGDRSDLQSDHFDFKFSITRRNT